MFGWPRKSRSTSGTGGTWRYRWLCLIHFWNFFTIYVFEVRKVICDIPTELPCSGDLENPGQLPVQEVLEGTDDFVLWIFTISSVCMFSRSRNSLLTFPMSCYVWVTSKTQVNFRYRRYSKVLMNVSYWFWKYLHCLCFWGQGIHCWHSYRATIFGWPWKSRSTSGSRGTDDFVLRIFTISSVFMFLRSRNPMPTFLLIYHVRVTSKLLVNFRYMRYLKVLMILSYGFSQFLQYLCFRGQGIHCRHSYRATRFEWLWKSRSTSGSRGTDDSDLHDFEISSLFMFSRLRNPLLIFPLSYHVRVTSKIWVNFRY